MSRIDIIGQNGNDGLHYADTYKDRAKELADAHWEYIESLLTAHNTPQDDVRIAKFHYLSAAEHFYKHALEDIQEGYYATK